MSGESQNTQDTPEIYIVEICIVERVTEFLTFHLHQLHFYHINKMYNMSTTIKDFYKNIQELETVIHVDTEMCVALNKLFD